jgi:acetylcholinesterase
VIHGDSAGGGSIIYQLTAFGGQDDGLFVGGIAESPFIPTHRTVPESEFQFDRFAASLNCADAQDPVACLRSLDTATLQSADVVSTFPGTPENVEPDFYFLPVVDGTFSPDFVYRMLEEGRVARVPVMVGDDTDEGTAFGFSPNATTSEEFLQFIQANYPHLNDTELQLIKEAYPPGKVFPLHALFFTPSEEAYGEATFICPGVELTKSIASFVSPEEVWNYRYNVYDPTDEFAGLGVPHVSEEPAIWGPGNSGPCDDPCSYRNLNAPIVPIMMNYWISFIRTLNPNTFKAPSALEWEPWGTGTGQRLRIQLAAMGMEPVPNDQLARCEMWKNLATTTEQ